MKKALYIIIPLVLLAIVVIRLKNNQDTAESRIYYYDKQQAILVQADTLNYEQVAAQYTYTGTFEPNTETRISSETQGKVTAVYVEAGSFVKQAQPLIQLDNSLLKLQLRSIEVQIEGLENDVKRYTALVEADAVEGVQLEKAILGLKSAKVQRSTLLEQIHKSRILAPFSGIVTAKLTEVGAYAAPGIPLLQLTDISQLRFTVNVPENELGAFHQNQHYTLASDAYPQTPLSGQVILIGSKANTGNRYPVQFAVANTEDLKIKSGMFGKVQLQEEAGIAQLLIPASAIVGSTVQPRVYLVKEGKAVLQDITVSRRIKNKAVVENGVNAGDVIISNGFINLFDGAPVEIKKL